MQKISGNEFPDITQNNFSNFGLKSEAMNVQ